MNILAGYRYAEEAGTKSCRLQNEYTYNTDGLVFSKTFDTSAPAPQITSCSYYSADILGSIKLITDSSGKSISSYSYSAYGVCVNNTPDMTQPFGFNGKHYDPALLSYNYGFRQYSPYRRQWMTEDPIRDGADWYAFCNSDPVNRIDPLGLESGMKNKGLGFDNRGPTPENVHTFYEERYGIKNSVSIGEDYPFGTDMGLSGQGGVRSGNISLNMATYTPKWEGKGYEYPPVPNDNLILPENNNYFYDPFTVSVNNAVPGMTITAGANWHEAGGKIQNTVHQWKIAESTPQLIRPDKSSPILAVSGSQEILQGKFGSMSLGIMTGTQSSVSAGGALTGSTTFRKFEISSMIFGGIDAGLLPQFESSTGNQFGARVRAGVRVDIKYDPVFIGLSGTADYNTINPEVSNMYLGIHVGWK
jgi:RHS repeat-associated protein